MIPIKSSIMRYKRELRINNRTYCFYFSKEAKNATKRLIDDCIWNPPIFLGGSYLEAQAAFKVDILRFQQQQQNLHSKQHRRLYSLFIFLNRAIGRQYRIDLDVFEAHEHSSAQEQGPVSVDLGPNLGRLWYQETRLEGLDPIYQYVYDPARKGRQRKGSRRLV